MTGYLRSFERADDRGNEGLPPGQIAAVAPSTLPSPSSGFPGYVQLSRSDPEQTGLEVLPLPTVDEGRNISYAIQWLIFALVAISGWYFFLRREAREDAERAASEHDASEPIVNGVAMDLGLAGKVYVVSGGSRGLGYATARVLVDEGARVVILARDTVSVTEAVAALGEGAVGLSADVASESAADDAVEMAIGRFGQLDGALISVGGPPAGSVLTTTDDQWRAAFETVFLGSVRLARTACEGISATGCATTGSVAWVLSTSAVEVFPGLSTSNGLRPGLAMLVKDLADEVGPLGIRVNGLLPGRIATARLAALDAATGDAPGARARANAGIPLGRSGQPAEFGRVAAFVLSPASSYLTGSLIRVDGGSARHP